jgi:centrosomal protein CEP104
LLCVRRITDVSTFPMPVAGEDEHYRASELNAHGPTVVGWQSARECSYPQELILQLHSTATVQKIQVLAHQYLIRKSY